MTQGDPTDEALATIASILDHPQRYHGSEAPATRSPSIAPNEAHGYTRFGPGPIAAVRFKWSVRRGDHDQYFVEEMIGENPPSAVTGPMSAEAAVQLVDEREGAARARFEQIRREMISRSTAVNEAKSADES